MKTTITLLFFIFISFLMGCFSPSNEQWPITSKNLKPSQVHIQRYGEALFSLDTNNFLLELKRIQPEYQVFIGENFNQPQMYRQLYNFVTDTQLIQLNEKVQTIFPNLNSLETTLSDGFSRFHHFFPNKPLLSVYSYVSGIHYEKPIDKKDTLLIIALDVYLGKNFEPYKYLGLPQYRIRRMSPEYLVSDIMKSIYNHDLNPKYKQKTFLDRMIGAGKVMVYLDAVLPNVADSIKMGYTTQQWRWMESNKEKVWAYLVSNNLFYSSDYELQTKLIQDAPFTTGFSNESAPRVGVWLGWQIIRAYHSNHPDVSLQDIILNRDAQDILQKSGYKP